jgi:hypothetical protein
MMRKRRPRPSGSYMDARRSRQCGLSSPACLIWLRCGQAVWFDSTALAAASTGDPTSISRPFIITMREQRHCLFGISPIERESPRFIPLRINCLSKGLMSAGSHSHSPSLSSRLRIPGQRPPGLVPLPTRFLSSSTLSTYFIPSFPVSLTSDHHHAHLDDLHRAHPVHGCAGLCRADPVRALLPRTRPVLTIYTA